MQALYFGLSALEYSWNLVTQGVALGWDKAAPTALCELPLSCSFAL